MRTAITLILVILSLLLGNVFAAVSNSNGWVSVMMVFSCFLNSVLIAGIISTCEMRSSWLAYIITTSLFMMMVIIRPEGLTAVARNVAELIVGWGVMPPENSSLNFSPIDRLQAALEISCPPMFGVAAGFVAILCFPGKRLWKPAVSEYKQVGSLRSVR